MYDSPPPAPKFPTPDHLFLCINYVMCVRPRSRVPTSWYLNFWQFTHLPHQKLLECSWYQPHYFDILNMLKAKIRKHKSPSSIRCLRIKRTHSEVHNPPSGRSASWLWQQNSSRSQEGKKLWGQQFIRKKSCKKPSPESGSITGQLVL